MGFVPKLWLLDMSTAYKIPYNRVLTVAHIGFRVTIIGYMYSLMWFPPYSNLNEVPEQQPRKIQTKCTGGFFPPRVHVHSTLNPKP